MTEADEPRPEECLGRTEFIDCDHPAVGDFVETHQGSSTSDLGRVVALYYAVRDQFYYSPWGVSSNRQGFRASEVLARQARTGHCIDKALVLVACARHLGIPGRLHFANVRNHIGTADFEQRLGSDLLVFHGYSELFLQGRWVAATPAFNRALCDKLGVAPLEFDGTDDSIFQEFDKAGGRFMEYVHDYGSFPDLPYELMVSEWRKHYPEVASTGRWPQKHSK